MLINSLSMVNHGGRKSTTVNHSQPSLAKIDHSKL